MSSCGVTTDASSIRIGNLLLLLLLLSSLLLLLPASPLASSVTADDDAADAVSAGADGAHERERRDADDNDCDVLIVVKLGGSSITDKSRIETVNSTMLEWASDAISSALEANGGNWSRFVVVHGAGSFGHFVAREYGLRGQVDPPPTPGGGGQHAKNADTDNGEHMNEDGADIERSRLSEEERRLSRTKKMMTGLARTRLSVQRLNLIVVDHLLRRGVPAVSMSPCFSVPKMRAHGGGVDDDDGGIGEGGAMTQLVKVVREAVDAGLVPVLHGDACLYGVDDDPDDYRDVDAAGILGGDTIMSALATHPLLVDAVGDVRAVFLTDVDGVYTSDPNANPDAELLRTIEVDLDGTVVSGSTSTGARPSSPSSSGTQAEAGATAGVVDSDGGSDDGVCVDATGSRHEHDVTGGLRTKLRAAADIARRGIDVEIVRCGSHYAERALGVEVETMRPDVDGGGRGTEDHADELGTVVRLRRE